MAESIIRVASGIAINREGWILMGKRKSTALRPDLWELPGGKFEPDENPFRACQREWKEELGLDVVGAAYRMVGEIRLDHTFHLFLVTLERVGAEWPRSGELAPHTLDHQALFWTAPDYAMQYMACSPGYYIGYRDMLAMIAHHRTLR